MIPLLTGRPHPADVYPAMAGLHLINESFESCSSFSSNITSLKGLHRQRYKVGMTRFELATPRPPDVCATGLRYIPKKFIPVKYLLIPLFFILLSNIIAALLSRTMNL